MPTNVEMYDEAIRLHQQGKAEEAVGKLHALLEQDPGYALAHSALSVFYSRDDRHDEAIRHAEEVCRLEPDDPFSFIALSLVCQKAGQITQAEQAMMQARQVQFSAYQRGQQQ
jgi:Flp pilus assembly protein TadD